VEALIRPRWLTTGSNSGLGCYLSQQLGTAALSRDNTEQFFDKEFDVIIHCAFSKASREGLFDDLAFLKKIHAISHEKFVFISSVDVYSNKSRFNSEADVVQTSSQLTPYANEKIKCEEWVQSQVHDTNYMIIRPVSLFGSTIQNRNFNLLLNEQKPILSLTADSSWNFVTYDELSKLIQAFSNNRLHGIVNAGRTHSVTVQEVAELVNKKPSFGAFKYEVPKIINNKALQQLPELNETAIKFLKRQLKI
jgi:nucleoside-diphosphate-sugar epimerase